MVGKSCKAVATNGCWCVANHLTGDRICVELPGYSGDFMESGYNEELIREAIAIFPCDKVFVFQLIWGLCNHDKFYWTR